MKEKTMRPDMDKLEDWASYALGWSSEVLDANPPGGPRFIQ
jgi:hypothetical protein